MTKGLLAKKCTKCGEWKSRSEYYKHVRNGLRPDCKACVGVWARAHKAKLRARTSVVYPTCKRCPVCKEEKLAAAFGIDHGQPSGLSAICLACHAVRERDRRKSDPRTMVRMRETWGRKTESVNARKARVKRNAVRCLKQQIAIALCERMGLDLNKLAMERYDAERSANGKDE